ncbi:MAG: thioredoxin [Cyclobacteriaceae bacterium]|nr:thioredoxin [Cyclobacteriaceae bacterium]
MKSKAQTFTQLIQGSKPILVDFFATWCGPCKMMQPELEEVSKRMGDRVKVVKVDVDKNPVAASKYQVRGVPTLILFQQGKILWRQSGVIRANQLVGIIEKFADHRKADFSM